MKLPPKDQLIMGIHAIREVLRHAPDRLITLFTEPPRQKGRKAELVEQAEKQEISISYLPYDTLSHMAGSDSHQSFVAHIKGRKFYSVGEFLEKVEGEGRALVIMLDQIFDPQNFGAILRTAECLGAAGVVWSKNRGVDLTPTVTKASCGASELLPLIRISNLAEGVSEFQEGGFEAVATLLNSEAEKLTNFQFAPKTLLIMGSEGEGIQPLIQKRADRILYIPLSGKIESLNVTQAAAILCQAFKTF